MALNTFPNDCNAFPAFFFSFLIVRGEVLLSMYATAPAVAIAAALLIMVAAFIFIILSLSYRNIIDGHF